MQAKEVKALLTHLGSLLTAPGHHVDLDRLEHVLHDVLPTRSTRGTLNGRSRSNMRGGHSTQHAGAPAATPPSTHRGDPEAVTRVATGIVGMNYACTGATSAPGRVPVSYTHLTLPTKA